jgi:hypothetical protein
LVNAHAPRGALLLALSLLAVALAGRGAAAGQAAQPFLAEAPAVPIAERWVCNLNEQPGARAANIQGQDGGVSLQIDGTTYWFFGDTEYTGSFGKNIRNNVAWTSDTNASDCVSLTHKSAPYGVTRLAQPLLGGPAAWPGGPASLQDGFLHFFYGEPREADPLIRVRGIGIARAPLDTLDAERLNGGAFLWDDEALGDLNLGLASATVADDTATGDAYLYVFFNSTPNGIAGTATDVLLGRVPTTCDATGCAAEDESNYQYWGGAAGWVDDLAGAVSLWHEELPHNGPSVAYNTYLGKWTAAYALYPPLGSVSYRSHLRLRVADSPEGPWSPPTLLLDCLRYHDAPDGHGFDCYSAGQHPQFASNGGRTQYISFSTNYGVLPHRVYHEEIHEVQLAVPVWQCDAAATKEYVVGGPDCATPEGIAFYAIDPATGPPPEGFEAVWRWSDEATGEVQYAPEAPAGDGWTSDLEPSFYTPDPERVDITSYAYDPVYRWDAADEPSKHVYSALPLGAGYTNAGLAFAAICPDSDGDRSSDCRAAFGAAGLAYPDSDGDGCDDARELGTQAGFGGRRDPVDDWDFFDTPDIGNTRDSRMTVGDLMRILARFGQHGDPTGEPSVAPPPAPAYHPAFDRSRKNSATDPWDLSAPDGSIGVQDIFLGVQQFGHSCATG